MRTSWRGGRIITPAIVARMIGRLDGDGGRADRARACGTLCAEVLPGEREVARLLGDVDPHDPLEQRVDVAPLRSAARCTWSIGSSPPSTNTKNSSGNRRAIADHPARAELDVPGEARGVEAGAVDELLEHQRVLRLLDDLVVGVAELGRRRWAA